MGRKALRNRGGNWGEEAGNFAKQTKNVPVFCKKGEFMLEKVSIIEYNISSVLRVEPGS